MDGRWLKPASDSVMSGFRWGSAHSVCQSRDALVSATLKSVATAKVWIANQCLSKVGRRLKSMSQREVGCSVSVLFFSFDTAHVSRLLAMGISTSLPWASHQLDRRIENARHTLYVPAAKHNALESVSTRSSRRVFCLRLTYGPTDATMHTKPNPSGAREVL